MSQVESIDVQRLRWFVAVAEELHFARAAKSLGIARQRLSRTVIDLETELGTKLFVPGAQPTQLTDEGRALLAAARAVIARREVAEPEPAVTAELRVGFVPGVTVSKWERIWAERFPEVPLRTIPLAATGQLTALRDGQVDMCFVRLPIDREGLSAIPLYREMPVVVVPKEHPISLFTEVTAADLADERMQDASDIDAAAVTFEMVAAGVGLAIVPHSIARLHARRDLVYRTVTDHPDTEIALAWPTAETTELVEEFVGVVRGRSERSSRSPSTTAARQPKTATKKPVAQKKSAAGKSATPARGARSSGAKKPSKRRGR
ncbi:DNA-binding transcriptional regulator, LysR family [Nocardia amikacinitolerans]|uniref:LysR family transcriptional regulator n=1 Tax=Nocardia amikacinitolerans TaxID=756689 RepID=UPI000A03AFA0|nr:LysR family transcriptional regulator [Nocardia amikacinitolerans]MCP2316923.1 DNA-binding transcriptional regulator, LysR family [Nocardia amikacinitolerans]